MPWRNTPENFFPWCGAAHGRAQEPTPGSAVEFEGESVRKNRPLVPRSNIAGSWARGGGGDEKGQSSRETPNGWWLLPGGPSYVFSPWGALDRARWRDVYTDHIVEDKVYATALWP